MGRPIKPVSPSNKFKWSTLLDPANVKPKDLPNKAGIYKAVVCDSNGGPKSLPGEPQNSPMKGVVYVGMTGKNNTLKNRFCDLARSWRTNAKWTKPPHGSRIHYDKDPKAQKLFQVAEVRIQYMELPSDAHAEHQAIVDLQNKLGLDEGDVRKIVGLPLTGDNRVADMEAINMQAFKNTGGYIPILNRDEEGRGDKPPTDTELQRLLGKT